MLKFLKNIVSLLTVCLCLNTLNAASDSLLNKYATAIANNDWAKAESFWDKSALEKSKALGIEYPDNPLKIDMASPLIKYRDQIKEGSLSFDILGIDNPTDNKAEIKIQVTNVKDTLPYTYFAIKSDNQWQLTGRTQYFAFDWPIINTDFTRIHFTDSSRINSIAINKLDKFIAKTCQTLEIPIDKINRLRDTKIDYYLCDSNQVKDLTGYDTNGMTDMGVDAIITQHLPHEHELVHLLTNYALENRKLYPLPFLQEGLACALGGRWDKSPLVVDYAGYMIMNYGVVDIDDLLTFKGFNQTIGTADLSYPVSSLLVGYLINQMGMPSFKDLYSALSADNPDEVEKMTADDIKTAISDKTGLRWEDIETGFTDYWHQKNNGGMLPLSIDTLPNDGRATITRTADGYDITAQLRPGFANGEIFLIEEDIKALEYPYRSQLFEQQFGQGNYVGHRFGIKYNASEIGLYDYSVNKLIAKVLTNLHEPNQFFDNEKQILKVTIPLNILDNIDPENYYLTAAFE